MIQRSRTPVVHFAILGVLGAALTLVVTWGFGPAISSDAVHFLSTAENLAQGRGFTTYTGGALVLWPPLYPALLALPRALFGIDPATSGWILNALVFGGIVMLTGVLFLQYLPRRSAWAYVAAIALTFSTSLFALAIAQTTDLLFVFLVLLFFVVFHRYASEIDHRSFAALIVIAALAALQRYIGVTLIMAGAFGIFLVQREEPRLAMRRAVLFGAAAAAPLIVWLGRNYALTGTLIGKRNPTAWRFLANLEDGGIKMLHWYLPYPLAEWTFLWALVPLLLVLSLIWPGRGAWRALIARLRRPELFTALSFAVLYFLATLVLTKTEDHYMVWDDRYYTPLFAFNLLVIVLLVDGLLLARMEGGKRRWAGFLLAAVFAAWALYMARGTYEISHLAITERGVAHYNTYNTVEFRESEVTLMLDEFLSPPPAKIYSNQAAAVSLFAGQRASATPVKENLYGEEIPLESYQGTWPSAFPALIVWYEPNYKDNRYKPEELQEIFGLEILFESEDGAIYRIKPSGE